MMCEWLHTMWWRRLVDDCCNEDIRECLAFSIIDFFCFVLSFCHLLCSFLYSDRRLRCNPRSTISKNEKESIKQHFLCFLFIVHRATEHEIKITKTIMIMLTWTNICCSYQWGKQSNWYKFLLKLYVEKLQPSSIVIDRTCLAAIIKCLTFFNL